ncbi:MAG: hypothetical protein KAT77_05650 [Nanoarchaeota archaeon]|nr:hypothetical protein [Nanoarchaeota archaeon]
MAKRKVKKIKISKKWIPAPLPASFMLTAILGFIISALWVFPLSYNWGLTFLIFFSLMFITAVINMTRAPPLPKYKK